MNIFTIIIGLIILYFIVELAMGAYRYYPRAPIDLKQRYGDGWVVITGGSSGQGKQFALQFASKGFDLVLIGSKNSYKTADEVKKLYGVDTIVIEKNFNHSYEKDFFDYMRDHKDTCQKKFYERRPYHNGRIWNIFLYYGFD